MATRLRTTGASGRPAASNGWTLALVDPASMARTTGDEGTYDGLVQSPGPGTAPRSGRPETGPRSGRPETGPYHGRDMHRLAPLALAVALAVPAAACGSGKNPTPVVVAMAGQTVAPEPVWKALRQPQAVVKAVRGETLAAPTFAN